MYNFSSKILEQKKTIFFVIFIFALFANFFLIPIVKTSFHSSEFVVKAQSIDFPQECTTQAGIDKWSKPDVSGSNWNGTWAWATNPGTVISLAIAKIFEYATYYLALLSKYILINTLSTLESLTIISPSGVFYPGWAVVRDLANMLIVLGFVIVGIATALRIRDYEAKQLLPKLIIIALLINFSGLFCGLIIDATNIIITGGFSGGASGTGTITQITQTFNCLHNSRLTVSLLNDNVPLYIGYSAIFDLIAIVIAFDFFYLAVLLIARYAILGILFILSPLAFSFWVYPASKKLWSEWWNAFLKWSFMGVGLMFSLWIASVVFGSTTVNNTTPDVLLKIIISLLIIYVGVKMTSKSNGIAAMASSAIMGIATGGAGLAMGAAGKVGGGGAKALDKLSGGAGSAAAQKVSSVAGRGLERMGLRQTGTTAETNKQRVEKEAAPLATAYAAAKATGDTATMDRIQKQAKQGKGAQQAAAYKVVSDAKDLHKAFADSSKPGGVDYQKAANQASYAESVGATGVIKTSENAMPKLAEYNKASVNEIMKKDPIKYPNTTAGQAAAGREAVRKKTSEMGVADMRSMPAPQMDADFFEMANPQTLKRAGLEFNGDQRAISKAALPELRDRRNQELITAHVAAGGPAFTGPNTAANRDTYYQANLSTDALSNKYKAMNPSAQAAWGTALSAPEKKIYDEAGGMANADRAYAAVERNKMDIASGGKVGTLENSIKAIKAINT